MQSLKTESSFTFLTIAKGVISGIARELKLLLQQFMEPDQYPITPPPKSSAEGEMHILQFPSTRIYLWKPCEDISTYELALCMPLIVVGTTADGWMQMNSMYEGLPAAAQRHWYVEGSDG
jgi:hypothetical protein